MHGSVSIPAAVLHHGALEFPRSQSVLGTAIGTGACAQFLCASFAVRIADRVGVRASAEAIRADVESEDTVEKIDGARHPPEHEANR